MITIPSHKIYDQIYQGSMNILYRGQREQDNAPVIIKTPSSEYPNTRELAKLSHEYEITKDLGIKGILRPYSLHKYENSLVLIFEDIGGQSLKILLALEKMSLKGFLAIAISLAETLDQLHQNNIIHKDINPDHIIINVQTGEVKLWGFGNASSLPREDPGTLSLSFTGGTLAYISPEQSGRMNRILDYRTDFYSLGVTFYEILTGKLPFQATDPLELVHYHMAKQPVPPHKVDPQIPKVLSDIVLRLMAKTAEDRYQSASGLKADLEECLSRLEATGVIEEFQIGRHDISEKLRIAQGLYGREPEIEFLLKAFNQVSQEKTKMVMVSGYAGVGKTSLVKEIGKSISRDRGYFISGKFDQLQRNIPYRPLISACQDLVHELLTEGKTKLERWKEELLAGLGANGQIIIDVIPEIELMIGPQPPVIELGPVESQNRFNLVFRDFIRVLGKKEHPLVIFLDDLQWVDPDSVKLIELIMTDEDTKYLFLIGAYRDNEVDRSHHLTIFFEKLQMETRPFDIVVLGPLNLEHLTQLIADTLKSEKEAVTPLAKLVFQKTNGNPFFVNQFLSTLYNERLLVFDTDERRWKWEMSKIRSLDITDNVVDLLINRLQRLSLETQHVLRLAACIGNRFDIGTLSLVTEHKAADTFQYLLPALQEGLAISTAGSLGRGDKDPGINDEVETFKFQHDRVQQAAYALIDEEGKKGVHLKVGRLLLGNMGPELQEERIFDILNHLNIGIDLIAQQPERDELVELNLKAARKARASAAYEVAFNYLRIGLNLLGGDCWQRKYELTLTLYNEAAEAAYLSGHFEEMERWTKIVTQNAQTVLGRVGVYQCRILGNIAQNKPLQALEAGLEILNMLGVSFPKELRPSVVRHYIKETQSTFTMQRIGDLIDLPEMTDPFKLATLQILAETLLPAYLTRFEIFVLLTLKAIELQVKYGNTSFSPLFYCYYGSILCGFMGDIDSGYLFGKVGLRFLERLNAKKIRCRTLLIFNTHIRHFKEHVKETIKPLAEAYQSGLETGDLLGAGLSANTLCIREYMTGINLVTVEKEMAQYNRAIKKINQLITLDIYQQAVLNLLIDSGDPCLLIGEAYNEQSQLQFYQEANNRSMLHYLYFNKLILCSLFGQYDEALKYSAMAEKYLNEVTAGLAVPVFHYYDSLVRLAVYASRSVTEQKRILKKVVANQRKMKTWADHAPMNHLHKFHLVEAERCRVLGQDMEAIEHYDRAIGLAKENGYVHEEAYANELAARFWLGRGKEEFARFYIRKAYRGYTVWGGVRKVKHLEEKYRWLLSGTPVESATIEHIAASSGILGLDLSTMMKASQAISSEILLDRLLTTFMKIVIENVGAQQGCLILNSEGKLLIEVKGSIDEGEVLLRPPVPVEEGEYLSVGIVNYVARTNNHVVLDDAAKEGMFTNDLYIQSRRPKSVICAPILHKSKLTAILYLENNLISRAFTSKRIEVLNILASQISISIENARLYGDLKKAEEKYRAIFENAVEGIYQTTLEGRFISVNPAMARLFGFDSAEELMENTSDIAHQLYVSPKRRSEFIAMMQEGQNVSGFEAEFHRKDGSTFWASLHSRPVLDENNKLLFFEGIITDMSEQKKAMEALREREEYLRKENIRLRSNIKDRYKFGNIVGKSPAMQEVYELILRAAATDVNVIIYGESGTGKELVARAIHDMSDRKNGTFVPVNSGAIPENLLESEFFGYKKGAFTGAIADKHGYLDLADGGTLFMDELGEIDLNIQAKLLRAIEGGGFMPVGSTELKKSDFRIISATSRDLKEQVKKGLMREDFYYRVHIIPIYLPSLRERKEDIPLLVDHFLKAYEYEGKVPPITGKVLEAMLDYDWPGNVRELQNTLHRYFTLKRLDFLGAPFQMSGRRDEIPNHEMQNGDPKLQDAVENFEKNYILKKLEENQWHRTRVASILGIARKTLFRKIYEYGLIKTQKRS